MTGNFKAVQWSFLCILLRVVERQQINSNKQTKIYLNRKSQIYTMNLLKACYDAKPRIVRKICGSTKRQQQLALRDNHNFGPLHFAVLRENIEILKILLNQSCLDLRAESYEGQTALLLACTKPTVPLEIIALLIAKDPDLVNWVNNELVSPLQFAVKNRRLDIVRLLIEQGNADPNYKDLDSEHALFYAVYAFDLPLINYLMHETKCDMQHRNVNNLTAYDLLLHHRSYFTDSEAYCLCIVDMFRLTYDEFCTPEIVSQHIQNCLLDPIDGLMIAILEMFYLSNRINPEYCELVGRLLNVDLHSNSSRGIQDNFWLCFPLQSENVIELCADTMLRFSGAQDYLSLLLRLFVYDREVFNTYLPLITHNLPTWYFAQLFSLNDIEEVTENPNLRGYMFEFFKTICIFGFNPETILAQKQPTKLIQFLYPLIATPRPFISCSAINDSVVCRHFEETDSGEDVQRYADFRIRYELGLSYGYVPTLFCLTRSVVRETVFRACPATDQPYTKLSKLLTLRVPRIIQNRLVYIKNIDYKF